MTSTYVMKCMLVKESEVEYGNVNEPNDMLEVLRSIGLHNQADESVYVLCFDTKGRVIGVHEVAHGSMNSAGIEPKEVFKRALLNNAYAIALAHNHPSGDTTPSDEDLKLTERIHEACRIMGIKLIEHLIVSTNSWHSMAENEELKN